MPEPLEVLGWLRVVQVDRSEWLVVVQKVVDPFGHALRVDRGEQLERDPTQVRHLHTDQNSTRPDAMPVAGVTPAPRVVMGATIPAVELGADPDATLERPVVDGRVLEGLDGVE